MLGSILESGAFANYHIKMVLCHVLDGQSLEGSLRGCRSIWGGPNRRP